VSGRAYSLENAESNRNLSVSLSAVSVSLITFNLFFVSGHSSNLLLFQFVLGSIVLASFCFALAGATFYAVEILVAHQSPLAAAFDRRATTLFFVGVLIFALEPALILFTVSLPWVAIFAIALWVAFLLALRQNVRVLGLLD
jgi:hypothetical protein